MIWLILHLLLYGPAGFRDETLAAYAERDVAYRLEPAEDAPAVGTLTLRFPKVRSVEVRTHCASYHAALTVPYPWFRTARWQVADRHCDPGSQDLLFRDALRRMTLAEILGDTLILSNDIGEALIFRRHP